MAQLLNVQLDYFTYNILNYTKLLSIGQKSLADRGYQSLSYLKGVAGTDKFWAVLDEDAASPVQKIDCLIEFAEATKAELGKLTTAESTYAQIELKKLRAVIYDKVMLCDNEDKLKETYNQYKGKIGVELAAVEACQYAVNHQGLTLGQLNSLCYFAYQVAGLLYNLIAQEESVEKPEKPKIKQVKRLEELGLPTDTAKLKEFINKAVEEGEHGELFFWRDAKEVEYSEWQAAWLHWSDTVYIDTLHYFIEKLDPECNLNRKKPKPASKGNVSAAYTGLAAGNKLNYNTIINELAFQYEPAIPQPGLQKAMNAPKKAKKLLQGGWVDDGAAAG